MDACPVCGREATKEHLPGEVNLLKAQIHFLQRDLSIHEMRAHEVVWLTAYRNGVADAFDFLGERRDERMMILMRTENQKVRDER
jgi:hypothetical protein